MDKDNSVSEDNYGISQVPKITNEYEDSYEDILASTNLNPNAKEFIPGQFYYGGETEASVEENVNNIDPNINNLGIDNSVVQQLAQRSDNPVHELQQPINTTNLGAIKKTSKKGIPKAKKACKKNPGQWNCEDGEEKEEDTQKNATGRSDRTEKPKKAALKYVPGPITFRMKKTKSNESFSGFLVSDEPTLPPPPPASWVYSRLAKDLLKKYREYAARQPAPPMDIWTKLEMDLKERDKKIREEVFEFRY